MCRVEFVSTRRLIDEYFPREGRVRNIGRGLGRYCVELIRRGYRVTLFDFSQQLVERARVALDSRAWWRSGCRFCVN